MSQIRPVTYELVLAAEEALQGTTKLLKRNNKSLEVVIPPGVTTGSTVKLSNALQVTDGSPGDILIEVKVKAPEFKVPKSQKQSVIEVSDDSFESEVTHSELPVVVDFWAPWCGPCRMMAPIMEKAAASYQGKFKFCKINVDENPQKAAQFQAKSIPMLLFLMKGQVIDRIVGAVSEQVLKAKLDSLPV